MKLQSTPKSWESDSERHQHIEITSLQPKRFDQWTRRSWWRNHCSADHLSTPNCTFSLDSKKEKGKLGTIEQICQVVKQEGWDRLYGGLMPSLVGTAASQGVYYYFYQIFRNKAETAAFERKRKMIGDGSVGMFSSLVVAALSGCVNVLLTIPIWVVVTRMQTHTKKSRHSHTQSIAPEESILAAIEPPPYGTSHAIQEVYGEAGVWGFWKGVFPTLIMVSNPSIQFMLYETLLKKLKKRRASSKKGNDGITALEIFLLGALAKLGATVVTYPLLVVKSRLQAKQVTGGDKRHHYKGTFDAILKMIRYEGFYGFYKGMSTKIVQSVLAAAVLFMVKEELVKGARWGHSVPNSTEAKPTNSVVSGKEGGTLANTNNSANKNPKKANLLDHHSIKHILDESVNEIVISRGYIENLIIYTKEKNAILFTYPPTGSFNSTGLVVFSKLPRFSDMYTLTISSADPNSISAKEPVEFTKSVTQWFTKDGVLVEGLFWKDVDGLINDYAKESKKGK
ncbi:hypothetical protein F0562_031700 [Nyssa sinensis]|uniref:Signal peptidase complex subunit 2 n=1 Tax=Nyssa sinensis TaxID=561372 RepID=A0A5J5AXC4_9ASTE|nr:hypothetical protein F0562_031700 [Nyssa sinensis]